MESRQSKQAVRDSNEVQRCCYDRQPHKISPTAPTANKVPFLQRVSDTITSGLEKIFYRYVLVISDCETKNSQKKLGFLYMLYLTLKFRVTTLGEIHDFLHL